MRGVRRCLNLWEILMNANVLISCAGRRVELFQIWEQTLERLMPQSSVIVADAQPFAPTFIMSRERVLAPRVHSDQFIPKMIEICKTHGVRWVIPTIDTELPVLAQNRREFEKIGVEVVVSDLETIEIAGDKRKTHAWFVKNGFPTFRQVSIDEALQTPDWPYPCFVKPADGSRAVGAARVDSEQALRLRKMQGRGNDVVETLGCGVEVTVDAYVSLKTHRCLCAVPRQRLEVRDGEVSKGKTVASREILHMVKKVVEALPGARGPICVQLFWDAKTHAVRLMEINPRFAGGYPLTHASGAHFTDWIVEESLGLPCSASPAFRPDLVMLRYDQSVFIQG